MATPTYSDMIDSYDIWREYVDPSRTVSEKKFNKMSDGAKRKIITEAFGEERLCEKCSSRIPDYADECELSACNT